MKVKQEWNGQDVSITVTDRVSTHLPLDLIIVKYKTGYISDGDPLPSGMFYLVPETARALASKLNRIADRAEKEARESLDPAPRG